MKIKEINEGFLDTLKSMYGAFTPRASASSVSNRSAWKPVDSKDIYLHKELMNMGNQAMSGQLKLSRIDPNTRVEINQARKKENQPEIDWEKLENPAPATQPSNPDALHGLKPGDPNFNALKAGLAKRGFKTEAVDPNQLQAQLQAQVDAKARANVDRAYNRWNVYAEKIPDINDLAKSPNDYYRQVAEYTAQIMNDPIPTNIQYPDDPVSMDTVKQVIYQVATNHFNRKAAEIWKKATAAR